MDTRERWLRNAIEAFDPIFAGAELPIPTGVRASIGFPSRRALAPRRQSMAQCWSPMVSADGTTEIFVSPLVDEPEEVLGYLAHELLHAAVGTEYGHRAPFSRGMRAIGLTRGKPTTAQPGPKLMEQIRSFAEDLGVYPHAKLDPTISREKQIVRLIKVHCNNCGYIARTTRRWIEEGLPICPCGTRFSVA